jgi:molybdate transport system substrate-binding protein
MRPQWLVRSLSMIAMAALLLVRPACAADIHVMISSGFHGAYTELVPAFERATGHHLVTTRGPSMGDSPEAIPARLARGEAADVVILDGGAADELGKRGLVRGGSKVELARSLVGMVVREGTPKPDIGSVEALRRTLLAAKSIAYSDSGSGTFRRRCSASSASQTRSRPRAGRCADRRRASRSPLWSRGAKQRSASSRSAN